MQLCCSNEWEGITDQETEAQSYCRRFRQFHHSPVIKMLYEFVSNIYIYHHFLGSNAAIFFVDSLYMVSHGFQLYDALSYEIYRRIYPLDRNLCNCGRFCSIH